ncbi:hypothetical protein JQ613_14825 [Bradyrhizobium japonicum]|nr:hypothetical protein [Bradyrhizobium japonicum]
MSSDDALGLVDRIRSLPKRGRIRDWLDCADDDINGSMDILRTGDGLTLTYQAFRISGGRGSEHAICRVYLTTEQAVDLLLQLERAAGEAKRLNQADDRKEGALAA